MLHEVEGDVAVKGSAHCGIQVRSVAEVHAARAPFKAASLKTITEEATTCCYVVQDKVWAVDLDGREWEVCVVLAADARDTRNAPSFYCDLELMTPKTLQSF